MRVLFWLALIVLIYAALRKKAAQKMRAAQAEYEAQAARTPQAAPAAAAENMVQCAACQVYFPESEAVVHEGRIYCSQEHAGSHQV